MATNPVLARELVTTLRSARVFILQAIFVSVLVALVVWAWPHSAVQFQHERQKELAQSLFFLFAKGAMVMLAVMAPAMSAGAFTLEKERRTWDLLMTAPVSAQAIVGGKLMAAMGYLLLLIVSTLPILSVCFLLPGVDWFRIPALYAILFCVSLTFGMIGLVLSARFDRTQAALTITYLIALPLVLVLLVISTGIEHQFFSPAGAMTFAAIAFVVNLMLYASAVKKVKEPFDPAPKSVHEEDIRDQTGLILVPDEFPDNLLVPARRNDVMPDGLNPVREKELRYEIFGRGTLFVRLLVQISMLLSIPFVVFLYGEGVSERLSAEWVYVGYLLAFVMLVGPAFACGAFSKEREQRTLDMLCTTLITPWQLVWGKLYSAVRFGLVLTGLLGVSLVLAAVLKGDKFGPYRVELAGYAWIVVLTLIFCVTMALAWSMVMRTTLSSMIASYGTILVLFLAPLAAKPLSNIMQMDQDLDWYTITSPFTAIISINRDGAAKEPHLWIACSVFYVTLTVVLFSGLLLGARRLLRLPRGPGA